MGKQSHLILLDHCKREANVCSEFQVTFGYRQSMCVSTNLSSIEMQTGEKQDDVINICIEILKICIQNPNFYPGLNPYINGG